MHETMNWSIETLLYTNAIQGTKLFDVAAFTTSKASEREHASAFMS